MPHFMISKGERGEVGIPYQVKQALLKQYQDHLPQYEPLQVALRTELKFGYKESKQALQADRVIRKADVYKCGFCADPKEPYHALQEPILDTDDLIFSTLKIDADQLQRSNNSKNTENNVKVLEARRPDQRIRQQLNLNRNNNGQQLIQTKLQESKARLQAVMFGTPFLEACKLENRSTSGRVPPTILRTHETKAAWAHYAIEPEKNGKAVYYDQLHPPVQMKNGQQLNIGRDTGGLGAANRSNLKRRSARPESRTSQDNSLVTGRIFASRQDASRNPSLPANVPGHRKFQSLGPSTKGTQQHLMLGDYASSWKQADANDIENDRDLILKNELTQQVSSLKSLEAALSIKRDDDIREVTEQYFSVRNRLAEQRQRMSLALFEDLRRMDLERKRSFQRKSKSFTIGKGTMFVDDIREMRLRAEVKRKVEEAKILNQHPWWNELHNKVLSTGNKRHVSEHEEGLLGRMRRWV